ncbi:hypothetical protein MYX76_12740 [Desulfobacterota bacterium AH_259_B03_O07]|nr:hypothetical protein [Desulfobacterota bacterium AH_259_B03_O07]
MRDESAEIGKEIGATASMIEEDQSGSQGKRSQADRLIDLVESSEAILFHDENGDPYIQMPVKEDYVIHRVRDRNVRRWISRAFWEKYRKAPSSEAINSAFNVIESKACFDGSQHKLHIRVAHRDGKYYYDLNGSDIVEVTAECYKIIKNSDIPPLFKHYPHQEEQVIPQKSKAGDLRRLVETYFNIKDDGNENRSLLNVIDLVYCFIPDTPHAVDVFWGDTGAAKTTGGRVKKEIVDPSSLKTTKSPRNDAEFVQMASHHWVIVMDNLSYLPEWLSDLVCRLVTGEGLSKRVLYTDDEDFIYSFKSKVIINGLSQVAIRADLLDRAMLYKLEEIEEEDKTPEKEFWENFNKDKPLILGSIFDALSKTIGLVPNIKLEKKPRMADFAVWGCAIAEALGERATTFINAYYKNIGLHDVEVLEASTVASVLREFMEKRDEWQGTPTLLFSQLTDFAQSLGIKTNARDWPGNAAWLTKRLNEVKENLKTVGIEITDDRRDGSTRQIIVKKTPIKKARKLPSLPSLQKKHDLNEQNQGLTNDSKMTVADSTDSKMTVADSKEMDTVISNSLESLENDGNDSKTSNIPILSNVHLQGREFLTLKNENLIQIDEINENGKVISSRLITLKDPQFEALKMRCEKQKR